MEMIPLAPEESFWGVGGGEIGVHRKIQTKKLNLSTLPN